MSHQTSSKRSPPFWLLIGARKLVFFWHQSEARTAATVWNWSGKTLSPGALLAVLYFSLFHIYFPARLDFPSPQLSAPGFPRMHWDESTFTFFFSHITVIERGRVSFFPDINDQNYYRWLQLVMWVFKTEDHQFNKSVTAFLKKRNVMNI